MLTPLQQLVDVDPSLDETADLPAGWRAAVAITQAIATARPVDTRGATRVRPLPQQKNQLSLWSVGCSSKTDRIAHRAGGVGEWNRHFQCLRCIGRICARSRDGLLRH